MYHPVFVDSNKLDWIPTKTEGIFFKDLRWDKKIKAGAVMIRMDPNTTYPKHIHTTGEDFYIVEGELIIAEEKFTKGYYVYSPPQSEHEPRTETGAIVFAVFQGKIIHVKE